MADNQNSNRTINLYFLWRDSVAGSADSPQYGLRESSELLRLEAFMIFKIHRMLDLNTLILLIVAELQDAVDLELIRNGIDSRSFQCDIPLLM